jgi:hypothetical protein
VVVSVISLYAPPNCVSNSAYRAPIRLEASAVLQHPEFRFVLLPSHMLQREPAQQEGVMRWEDSTDTLAHVLDRRGGSTHDEWRYRVTESETDTDGAQLGLGMIVCVNLTKKYRRRVPSVSLQGVPER